MDNNLIPEYFPELSPQQLEQFNALRLLYEEWNAKINVISRKDIAHFYERHVLHSLAIARIIQFKPGTKILDVGTGGGFPGIPLAILFPDCHFYLVDSIGKKILVVQEVVKALGLKNVEAAHMRAEQVDDKFDFIVSRAVTRMKPFLQWVSKKVRKPSNNDLDNGILYLKGGDLKEEMKEIKRKNTIYPLASVFSQEFFETKALVHVPITS